MKIVIAGGTGLLGRAITEALRKRGHTLIILSRRAGPRQESAAASVRTVRWDGLTLGEWTQHVGGADAVINLSGASLGDGRWSARQKQEILDSRVKPTSVLIEAMRTVARRPALLVNASGTGYYGHVPEGDVDEDAPAGEDFLASVCVAWERASRAAQNLGVRVIQIRTAIVISREAPAFRKMTLPFRLFLGGWYGRGAQWFPWIHLQDAVRGYLHALDSRSLSGPVNLVSPDALRLKEFMSVMGRVMGRSAWMPVPAMGLRLLLGEMSELLLLGQRAVPKKLLESGFTFSFPNAQDALTEALGNQS